MHRRRHRAIGRLLDAWVDGELDPIGRGESIESHVAECWDCSVTAETTRLVKAALRARRRPTQLAEHRLQRFVGRLTR